MAARKVGEAGGTYDPGLCHQEAAAEIARNQQDSIPLVARGMDHNTGLCLPEAAEFVKSQQDMIPIFNLMSAVDPTAHPEVLSKKIIMNNYDYCCNRCNSNPLKKALEKKKSYLTSNGKKSKASKRHLKATIKRAVQHFKVLYMPCGHSICMKCLSDQEEQTLDGYIWCFTCRKRFNKVLISRIISPPAFGKKLFEILSAEITSSGAKCVYAQCTLKHLCLYHHPELSISFQDELELLPPTAPVAPLNRSEVELEWLPPTSPVGPLDRSEVQLELLPPTAPVAPLDRSEFELELLPPTAPVAPLDRSEVLEFADKTELKVYEDNFFTINMVVYGDVDSPGNPLLLPHEPNYDVIDKLQPIPVDRNWFWVIQELNFLLGNKPDVAMGIHSIDNVTNFLLLLHSRIVVDGRQPVPLSKLYNATLQHGVQITKHMLALLTAFEIVTS